MNKQGNFKGIFIVMILSLAIAFFWDNSSFIKNSAHSILDPTVGVLLNWNITWGMTIIILFISVIMTLAQKYGTDQETLREMKKEQKTLQEEIKKYKEHPQKNDGVAEKANGVYSQDDENKHETDDLYRNSVNLILQMVYGFFYSSRRSKILWIS